MSARRNTLIMTCERSEPKNVKGELGVFGFGRGVEVRLTFPPRINARETKKKKKKKRQALTRAVLHFTVRHAAPGTKSCTQAGNPGLKSTLL
jgi:hypothetical protein